MEAALYLALSFATREELLTDAMDLDNMAADGQYDGWEDADVEEAAVISNTLPPGEEGILHSHTGGESIFQQIMDDINIGYMIFSPLSKLLLSHTILVNKVINVLIATEPRITSIHGMRNCHDWWMPTFPGNTTVLKNQRRHHLVLYIQRCTIPSLHQTQCGR